jgi:hypothetical protein
MRILAVAGVGLLSIGAFAFFVGDPADIERKSRSPLPARSLPAPPKPRKRRHLAETRVVVPSVESAPAEIAALDAAPAAAHRTLRVVDEEGQPIQGVSVSRDAAHAWVTDVNGEASLDAAADRPRVSFFDGVRRREVLLEAPVTEVVATGMPTLDVSAIDAETGRAVEPFRFTVNCAGSQPRLVSARGKRPYLHVAEDGRCKFSLVIDPPSWYGGYRSVEFHEEVAARARTVRVVVPLYGVTMRTVRAGFADGRPARGAIVEAGHTGTQQPCSPRQPAYVTLRAAPSFADGLIHVTGLPLIPFTRIKLRVTRPGDDAGEPFVGWTDPFDPRAEPSGEPLVAVLQRSGGGACGAGQGGIG